MEKSQSSLYLFGFDHRAESQKLGLLSQLERQRVLTANLDAYVNEVIENQPVSIPYQYWVGPDSNIYTDPSFKPIFNLDRQIDIRERNGLIKNGINSAVDLAVSHPQEVVGLYSPIGPAAFDNENYHNPFSGIKFIYGQLYLMIYDGEKVNAVAVKTSKEGETWVDSLFVRHGNRFVFLPDEKQRTAAYIQSPILIGNQDNLNRLTGEKNQLIYKSKDKQYFLDEIIKQVMEKFSDQYVMGSKSTTEIAKVLSQRNSDEGLLKKAYLSLVYNHMKTNKQTEMSLSGSCGGRTTSLFELEDIFKPEIFQLENPYNKLISNLSSMSRIITQTGEKYDYHDGYCIVCDPGKNHKTDVGPCNICKACESSMN